MENKETEYKTLKNKLRYYERMINNNIQLTSKQEMKYNEYKQQLENIDYTPRAKLDYEEYKRLNKERAKQRYQRIKANKEK